MDVTRLAEDTFLWTPADPSLLWLTRIDGLDVTMKTCPSSGGARTQGPTSASCHAVRMRIPASNTSGYARPIPGGTVDISRTATPVDLGYESGCMVCATAVWDALPVAPFDIQPAGMLASTRARRAGCC